MPKLIHVLFLTLLLLAALAGALPGAPALALAARSEAIEASGRIDAAFRRHEARLEKELAEKGLRPGAPLFIRVFKTGESPRTAGPMYRAGRVEFWLRSERGDYRLALSHPICMISGKLGPKLREGDLQTPEGVYGLRPEGINPASAYHISYDIGYPNAVDRARGGTGSQIRIHGKCISYGCVALGSSTDEREIESATVLIVRAWQAGQAEVPVHIFPFPLTDTALQDHLRAQGNPARLASTWGELQPVYSSFERDRVPPEVRQRKGHYLVGPPRD